MPAHPSCPLSPPPALRLFPPPTCSQHFLLPRAPPGLKGLPLHSCIPLLQWSQHRAGPSPAAPPQLLEATSCPYPLISTARPRTGSCPLPPSNRQRHSWISGKVLHVSREWAVPSRPASPVCCYLKQPCSYFPAQESSMTP
jgi:hypothetical protein